MPYTRKRLVATASVLAITAAGCGSDTHVNAASPRRDSAQASQASSDQRMQQWLDTVREHSSIAVDASAFVPTEIARGPGVGLVSGEVAGPVRVALYGDSPFKPVGVADPTLRNYAFVVIPVWAAVGTPVTELWIELGLVDDPAALESLAEPAPPPGTRVIAAGAAYDRSLVSPGTYGVALEETNGNAAIGYLGPVEPMEGTSLQGEPVAFAQLVDDAARLTG